MHSQRWVSIGLHIARQRRPPRKPFIPEYIIDVAAGSACSGRHNAGRRKSAAPGAIFAVGSTMKRA